MSPTPVQSVFSPHDHGGNLEALCREHGVDPAGVLDFSANVNPLGPPSAMVEAMKSGLTRVDRYPELDGRRLRAALAGHAGAEPDWVLPGNGSSELLYLVMNTFRPNSVGIRTPAYSDYERAARSVDAQVEHFTVEFRKAQAENDLIVLGSPNNPTGKLTELTQLIDDIRARPDCRVVVDHAFFEFVRPFSELTPFAVDWPKNLFSLRSLTKFHGLAGVRLGYLFGRPEAIAEAAEKQAPWSVNCVAAAAAEALGDIGDYAERTRALVGRQRDRIIRELAEPGDDGRFSPDTDAALTTAQRRRRRTAYGIPFVFPSTANFVLLKMPDGAPDAAEMQRRCLKRGVLIRDGSNFTGLDRRHVRVAVRTAEENDRMLAAVKGAMEG